MSKYLVLLLLPSLAFSNAISVDISQPHVAVSGHVVPVTLECSSQVAHQYCCWTGPGLEDCSCDEKNCPIEARVESDQQRCQLTLKHPALYKGDWSCDLYFIKQGIQKNATTQIFVLNKGDEPEILPLFTQELVLDQDKESVPVEFDCHSSNASPWQSFRWFLAGHLISNKKVVQFDLKRNNFNQSLECEIEQRTKASGGQVLVSKGQVTLSFSMNPMIKNIFRHEKFQYEIQVESWPKPNFVRISAVEECNNQCVIYERQEGKYVMNTSPYLDTSSLIKDISVQQAESGAKVIIRIALQPNQSQAIEELYIGVGNNINEATAKIDLKSQNDQALQMGGGQDMTLIILIVCLIIICVVILLALAIHFRTFIWESFKCGVYLVPPEEDEEEIEKGQEGKSKGQL